MLEHLKRLGGDSLLYALMNVGTKLIAFLMLPVYAAYLGAAKLGALEMVDSFTSMLTFLVIFGTDSALSFFYFDTKDNLQKDKYVKNVMMFRFVIALIFLLISLFAGPFVSKLIVKTPGYEHIIQIALIILVIESITTLVLTYFRFEFLSKKVVSLTVLKLGLVALLSYVFLRFFQHSVDVIFYARVISALLVVVFILPHVKRFMTFKVDITVLKEILKYAAPLVPASIAFWVISWSNRIFLTHMDNLVHVGIYAVAVKYATVITLLTSSVQMAWRPYSMSIKDKADAKKIFSNIYIYVLVLGMVGLLGIATFIHYILDWMIKDPELRQASKYIAILSLGTFLNFYYLIISVGLFIEKQTKSVSFYFGIAAVISIILNVTLIPLLSLWGATLAVVICYLFACVSIFIKSQKIYYVPVSIFKMLVIFLGGLISIISIVYIQEYSSLSAFYASIPWLFFIIISGLALMKKKDKRVEDTN